MDMVASLQQAVNSWVLQNESLKGLSLFLTKRLPQLVTLLLVILVSQQAAHLTWQLAPNQPVQKTLPETKSVADSGSSVKQTPGLNVDKIAGLHLFGQAGVSNVPRQKLDTKAPETRLNLTLHGVFVEQDTGPEPGAGAAIIGRSGSKQEYYKVGNKVMDGVKLQAVFNDRVVLLRNGQSEVLKFPKTIKSTGASSILPPVSSAATKRGISLNSYREQFKNEPLKVFEHVRFVPVRSGKTLKGYRILPQKNRKLYNQLGIRPSDLVTAVNGVSLSNDSEAIKLLEQLKDADQINLEIIRRGKPQSLSLNLN
jgi:general secretion pathway protein C